MTEESYAWREEKTNEMGIFNAAWVIDAPWAHPIWKQYVVFLYDLTTKGVPVILYMPDATHEFALYAINPDHPIAKDSPIKDVSRLEPPNYVYQFRSTSNEEALNRVQVLVDKIVKGKLSPDGDFRWYWDGLLRDMYPLVR